MIFNFNENRRHSLINQSANLIALPSSFRKRYQRSSRDKIISRINNSRSESINRDNLFKKKKTKRII